MKQVKNFTYSIVLGLLFLGCKSTKIVQSIETMDPNISVKQIVKKHNKSQTEFNTLQGRLKVEYIQGDRSETHTLTLRMEYDKTIWINAFLNMVRVKITPEHVRFYNKLDNTYFDGDYALISDFLGTDLQFENLQKLLLGEAIFDIKPKEFKKKQKQDKKLLKNNNKSERKRVFKEFVNSKYLYDSNKTFVQKVIQKIICKFFSFYFYLGLLNIKIRIKFC